MADRDLLDLLRGPIASVGALELLLRLRESAPAAWGVERLIQELRSSRSQVESACARMTAGGLLRMNDAGQYFYAPVSDTLELLCSELAEIYRQKPVSVISALFTSEDRLRSFADAFRLKGEDE